MARLRDGDDLALNALMERWEQPAIGFATRYTNNRSDALELAQETFVRIYENRKRYRAKGKFSTWMFAIAANSVQEPCPLEAEAPQRRAGERTTASMSPQSLPSTEPESRCRKALAR